MICIIIHACLQILLIFRFCIELVFLCNCMKRHIIILFTLIGRVMRPFTFPYFMLKEGFKW